MDKKLIVILGGVVLIIGAFLPIAANPMRSASFIFPGQGTSWEGLALVACGLLGVILALIGQAKHAVWFGIVALGLLIWKYLEASSNFDEMRGQLSSLDNLPPEFAAQLSANMPSINYLGWIVLALGALIMVVGGAMAWKGPAASAPPPAA